MKTSGLGMTTVEPPGGPFIRHAPDGRREAYQGQPCSYCRDIVPIGRSECKTCGAPIHEP